MPRFKLIISNRNSTENLEVGITSTFQMQVREPYLIFRDAASASNNNSNTAAVTDEAIRGLWFHDGKEREQVHSYLENVVKSLQKIEEMERAREPPPSLATNVNEEGGKTTSAAAASPEKKKRGTPVEVNTNAAGAALLSTLNLNDNSREQTPQVAQSPQPSQPPATPTTTPAAAAAAATTQNHTNTLDKKSLQLALLSLIQDERFLDLIHAQYLKVASSRAQREQNQQQQGNKK